MKIILPHDFYPKLKNKHLLLDTSVFIDLFLPGNNTEFGTFFNNLKDNNTTLVTIDLVKMEFLIGAESQDKYDKKEKFVDEIIEAILPIQSETTKGMYEILKQYREDGRGLYMTDLSLCGMLSQYAGNLFLLMKNTNDFSSNIFELVTYMNLQYKKGLHVYGIYKF